MKIIFALFLTIILSACQTVGGTKVSFPDLPETLMVAPEPLKTLQPIEKSLAIQPNDSSPSEIPLSVILKSVTDNYKTCNLYREQIFGLQDWLINQKALNP